MSVISAVMSVISAVIAGGVAKRGGKQRIALVYFEWDFRVFRIRFLTV